jgi:predicted metal-dependent phosphoesterase TrpH
MTRPRKPIEIFGALFDAHVHTCYDLHDGLLTPEELVALNKRHGFNWVLAMNHDTMRGFTKVQRLAKANDFPCINGIEISTTFNHILAYGIQEWPYRSFAWDPETVIDHLRDQDCAIFLAHPCNNPWNGRWTPEIARRLDVDGIEWNNASNSILNKKTATLFDTFPKGRRIAGTDAHTPYTFGHAYTQVATTSSNPDDLVSAMKHGRCTPRGRYVPLVCVGIEQLIIVLKNKVIGYVNVDGKWFKTVQQEPGSIAPEGFPAANILDEKKLKVLTKPFATTWRKIILKKPPRLDYWHGC